MKHSTLHIESKRCQIQASSYSLIFFLSKVTEKLIENKPGEYTAILIIRKVTLLDQGKFTCHVEDFGLQLCNYTEIEVRTAPKVWLQPMSLTVRKVIFNSLVIYTYIHLDSIFNLFLGQRISHKVFQQTKL